MKKLWGAANLRVYGGGTHEGEFLDEVSRICGEYDAPSTSMSTTKGSAQLHGGQKAGTHLGHLHIGRSACLPGRGDAERPYPLVVRKIA